MRLGRAPPQQAARPRPPARPPAAAAGKPARPMAPHDRRRGGRRRERERGAGRMGRGRGPAVRASRPRPGGAAGVPVQLPVLREYQRSIVETALRFNTLVALPTGLGKTLIAAVVMYNFHPLVPDGKVVFLAPASRSSRSRSGRATRSSACAPSTRRAAGLGQSAERERLARAARLLLHAAGDGQRPQGGRVRAWRLRLRRHRRGRTRRRATSRT